MEVELLVVGEDGLVKMFSTLWAVVESANTEGAKIWQVLLSIIGGSSGPQLWRNTEMLLPLNEMGLTEAQKKAHMSFYLDVYYARKIINSPTE